MVPPLARPRTKPVCNYGRFSRAMLCAGLASAYMQAKAMRSLWASTASFCSIRYASG